MKIDYFNRIEKRWLFSGYIPLPDEAYWLNLGLFHRFNALSSWRKKVCD